MSVIRARNFVAKCRPARLGCGTCFDLTLSGPLHFRRQVPFGPYYADFASHTAKVILEVDGSQHADDAPLAYDQRRTTFLQSRGYLVLRFSNADVLNNLAGVFEALTGELNLAASTSTPPTGSAGPPSPQGGGIAD